MKQNFPARITPLEVRSVVNLLVEWRVQKKMSDEPDTLGGFPFRVRQPQPDRVHPRAVFHAQINDLVN